MKRDEVLRSVFFIGLGLIVGGFLVTMFQAPGVTMPFGPYHDGHGSAHQHGTDMMSVMMVESERAFLEKMIPHHQEAVDTSREVLERGATTNEVRVLAESIIAAQQKEIADMKRWYKEWYGTEYRLTGEYEPMMRELKGLEGEELDRVFLTDMIGHHMGAIMMARSVAPRAEHQEVTDLARSIVVVQMNEIMQMRSLLADIQATR